MAPQAPNPPGVALNLALALVTSSEAPLLLLDEHFIVVAASDSFCRAFGIAFDATTGRSVFEIGAGEWNAPRLKSLLSATLSGQADIEAYELDLDRPGRERRILMLRAQRLDYGEEAATSVLLTVTDVTDVRASEKLKDNLLREKAVLLQEVQHRVANSLQIIASVLLQSARKVNSVETRRHLNDAHQRVMSVAAVQQQLATTSLEQVALAPYLGQLCQSIAASMISDRDKLSLEVEADAALVGPETSVSLGLVVTELVINALKHAFPGGRTGRIKVGYRSAGEDWTLSVDDDGVGMPTATEAAKPGLGTSIIEALAHQLGATVEIDRTAPGTTVSLVHVKVAPAEDKGARPGPGALKAARRQAL
jgi:PAS domain S-box-containing protein